MKEPPNTQETINHRMQELCTVKLRSLEPPSAHQPSWERVVGDLATQRLQHPLIKEYAFNHIRDPTIT